MPCRRQVQESGQIPGPVLCAPLIREVDAKLLEFQASLQGDEWDLPTVAPAWKVRDAADFPESLDPFAHAAIPGQLGPVKSVR